MRFEKQYLISFKQHILFKDEFSLRVFHLCEMVPTADLQQLRRIAIDNSHWGKLHDTIQGNDPAPRRDPTRRDATRPDPTRRDATRRDATRRDATRRDATRRDATRRDATRRYDGSTFEPHLCSWRCLCLDPRLPYPYPPLLPRSTTSPPSLTPTTLIPTSAMSVAKAVVNTLSNRMASLSMTLLRQPLRP